MGRVWSEAGAGMGAGTGEDVAELAEARRRIAALTALELELRDSEERYRRMVEHAPDAIVVLDVERGCFDSVNPQAEVLFGRPREELLRLGPDELSPPEQPDGSESADAAGAWIARALAGETPSFTWVHRRGDGADITCEVRLLRLPAAGRTLVRGSIVAVDERLRAEAAMRAEELERARREAAEEAAEQLARIVETSSEAIFVKDLDGRYVVANSATAAILGTTSTELVGRRDRDFLDEAAAAAAERENALVLERGEAIELEKDVEGTNGRRSFLLRKQPLRDARGDVVGIAGIAVDVTERRLAERRRETRSRVSAALAAAADAGAVVDALHRELARSLGATATALALPGEAAGALVVVAAGEVAALATGSAAPALDDDVPLACAARTGDVLVYDSRADLLARHPRLRGADLPEGFLVAVPLATEGQPNGAAAVAFPRDAPLDEDDLPLVRGALEQAGSVLERLRAHDAERAALARVSALQEATAALTQALRVKDVARCVVDHVPRLVGASAVTIGTVALDAGEIEMAAAVGYPPQFLERFRRIPFDAPLILTEALRSRVPMFFEDMSAVVDRYPGLPLLGPTDAAVAALPLVVEHRVLGAVVLRFARHRSFDPATVELLTTLAELAAQALDRARLYEREHEIATALQHDLLPSRLPEVEGIRLAAVYRGGTDGIAVGGDWYDAVELPDGRLGLAVGDVVGRGLEAATTMGQLRSALAALALAFDDPADVLDRLERTLDHEDGRLVTVCYAVLDPAEGELRFASAGHPPPLLVGPDGSATVLWDGRSAALGIGIPGPRDTAVLPVAPGSTLVLYTDGLVERRSESIDVGLDRLSRACERAAELEVDGLCARVVDELLRDGSPGDDLALLAACLRQPVRRGFSRRLPAAAHELAGLRAELGRWLAGAGASPDESFDVLVACTEACANAIEHGYASGPPGVVTVDAVLRAGADGAAAEEIVVTVRDEGAWLPRALDPERGRGIALMQRLMTGVAIARSGGGTEVVLRRRIGTGDRLLV